jgi:hypothetical protein
MLFPRALFERGGVIAGGYDHIASWGGRLHGSSELQAIHTRHQIVGDQEWDGTLGQVAQCAVRIARRNNVKCGGQLVHEEIQQGQDIGIIIDNQNDGQLGAPSRHGGVADDQTAANSAIPVSRGRSPPGGRTRRAWAGSGRRPRHAPGAPAPVSDRR